MDGLARLRSEGIVLRFFGGKLLERGGEGRSAAAGFL